MIAAVPRSVRMIAQSTAIAAGILTFSTALHAQEPDPECASSLTAGDACQKTVDIFRYTAPQLGILLSGGSATPGGYGALGRPGRFSVNIRATAARLDVPDVSDLTVGASTPVPSTILTTEEWGAGPAFDAELGVFGGVQLGVVTVGAIDLLGSAFYIPELETDNFNLTVAGNGFKFGGGVRVGIIQENLTWPGVSISYIRRGLPSVSVEALTDDGDSLRVSDISLDVDALRLMVGKRLGILGVMAGVGTDRYKSGATISAVVEELGLITVLDPTDVDQSVRRTNLFAGASLNFPFVRLVGEVGRVSGDSVTTYNTFQSSGSDDARMYMSVGIRFGT